MRRTFRATLTALLLALVVLPVAQACTDLDEDPASFISPDNFFRTEGEVIAALAGVYAQMASYLDNYYNVSQVTSEEHIVPTRGSDWYDNGRWLQLEWQQWTANSPSALDDINGAWNNAFSGVVKANAVLAAIEPAEFANKEAVIAELRTLRAFFYYQLMDMFGGVPKVTDTELLARPKNSRQEIFDFIKTELEEARDDLPTTWPAANHGRVTQGVADIILANMFLNAAVFTKETGINATGYNSCMTVQIDGQTACAAAVDAADRVIESGAYQLATNWRSNFTADNENSAENILVVKRLNEPGLGLNFVMRLAHYNQHTPSPWNGFATIAEVYNAFDANDQRRDIFLVGPQNNFDTGEPACVRPGCAAGAPRLDFTVAIADPEAATEAEGARLYKWPSDPDHVAENHGNDFAIFRLAEAYLIKAEALFEMGQTAEALTIINMLRARVFEPDEPLAALTRADILNERLFELTGEAKRRQDQIRFGTFLDPRPSVEKPDRTGQPHLVLFPIPQSQIDANPELDQNPGY